MESNDNDVRRVNTAIRVIKRIVFTGKGLETLPTIFSRLLTFSESRDLGIDAMVYLLDEILDDTLFENIVVDVLLKHKNMNTTIGILQRVSQTKLEKLEKKKEVEALLA